MPTGSKYPALDIPNVDIWDFVFSRTDREYPEDKGDHRIYTILELQHVNEVIVIHSTIFGP